MFNSGGERERIKKVSFGDFAIYKRLKGGTSIDRSAVYVLLPLFSVCNISEVAFLGLKGKVKFVVM